MRYQRTTFAERLVCITALSSLGLIPFNTVADISPDHRYFKQRFYAGAGVGPSTLSPETPNDALEVSDDQSMGFSLQGGYDLSPRFSLDAYIGHLGGAGINFLGTPVGDVDYTVYGASLISYLYNVGSPYTSKYVDDGLYQREGLSLYTRVGVGGMANGGVSYDRDHSFHLAAGAGLEYGLANGIALRAEYTSYDTDAQLLSLSAIKRFGEPSYARTAEISDDMVVPQQVVAEPPAPTPPPVQAAPPVDRTITLFDFNQKDVPYSYTAQLNALAIALTDYEDIEVQIDGHTDWVGSGGFNQRLSEERAVSVATYLMNRGISADRLSVAGYGEMEPVADNRTEEGRAQNRRVEISRVR